MPSPAAVIAARIDSWGFVPRILGELFPGGSPSDVAAALDTLCRTRLGAGVESGLFFEASVGSVHGLVLADGRRVVVKGHGARTSAAYLCAAQRVQRQLAAGGFPAPQPLLAPVPFGRGLATAESLLEGGVRPDAHEPPVRRALAASLAELVRLCRPLAGLEALRRHAMVLAPGALWPHPHDGRFDFEATAGGAEWIDAIAADALSRREAPAGDLVVGHGDWRAEHVRLDAGRLAAVYDWDSIIAAREPLLVGSVAHAFTADWSLPGRRQLPSLPEALAFVADYEAARGAPFDAAERAVARASLVYTMAYSARCEHSDALTDFGRRPPLAAAAPAPDGSARAFLAAHARALLTS